jgi:hypothetical protein
MSLRRALPAVCAAAVLLVCGGASARADFITVDLPAVPASVTPLSGNLTFKLANTPGSTSSYTAFSSNLIGLIHWKDSFTQKPYQTFCIEITQDIITPSTKDTYTLVQLAQAPNPNNGPLYGQKGNTAVYGPTGQVKASAIDKLYAADYPAVLNASINDQAAFQVAVWKLVYDGPTNTNLSQGNLKVLAADNPGLTAIVTKAQSYLNGLAGITNTTAFDSKYSLIAWTSSTLQDQVQVVPVPAPPALVLGLIGGASLAGFALRRKVVAMVGNG